MRQRVANHKGVQDWADRGPRSPLSIGPYGERHSKGGVYEDASVYGAYFGTPGHRVPVVVKANDIEVSYDAHV